MSPTSCCCNERRRNRPEQSAHGLFLPEIAHPFKALDRARVAVEFASPLGGKPPEDGFDADDPAQTTFLDSKADRRLSRRRKSSKSTGSTTTPLLPWRAWTNG